MNSCQAEMHHLSYSRSPALGECLKNGGRRKGNESQYLNIECLNHRVMSKYHCSNVLKVSGTSCTSEFWAQLESDNVKT